MNSVSIISSMAQLWFIQISLRMVRL